MLERNLGAAAVSFWIAPSQIVEVKGLDFRTFESFSKDLRDELSVVLDQTGKNILAVMVSMAEQRERTLQDLRCVVFAAISQWQPLHRKTRAHAGSRWSEFCLATPTETDPEESVAR